MFVALRVSPMSGFPCPTNLRGAYLVVRLDGTIEFANSTYAIDGADRPPASGAPPLDIKLNVWYALKVVVDDSALRFTLRSGTGAVMRRGNCTLDELGSPAAGQFAVGLVDYGGAAIDDLFVSGSPAYID